MNGYRSSVITKYLSEAMKTSRKIISVIINEIMDSRYCIPTDKIS